MYRELFIDKEITNSCPRQPGSSRGGWLRPPHFVPVKARKPLSLRHFCALANAAVLAGDDKKCKKNSNPGQGAGPANRPPKLPGTSWESHRAGDSPGITWFFTELRGTPRASQSPGPAHSRWWAELPSTPLVFCLASGLSRKSVMNHFPAVLLGAAFSGKSCLTAVV